MLTRRTKKKSVSQLRRLEKRASLRGEEYHQHPTTESSLTGEKDKAEDDITIGHTSSSSPSRVPDDDVVSHNNVEGTGTENEMNDEQRRRRLEIARRLRQELIDIEQNTELKAKDRRSARRKAEAIAAEECGMSSGAVLLEWYQKKHGRDGQSIEGVDGDTDDTDKGGATGTTRPVIDPKMEQNMAAAKKLRSELDAIEKDETLKSKDRRSAKRKAEAIASEATGMDAEELLKWYEKTNKKMKQSTKDPSQKGTTKDDHPARRHQHDPYIAFFGQLSYETTKEDLIEHIRSQLGDIYKVSDSTVKVRMLTDPKKDNRFRGMAFVQVDDPDFLYALLKLHQTYLKGRRINVEKSAGGKKGSDTRQQKLLQHKKEQQEYFAQVVQSILDEYRATGELRDDELDEGVITLCKRHAGPVVRAAVAEYIEKGGRDMDNPSAYLTFLVAKFASEGIHDQEETGKSKKGGNKKDNNTNTNPRKRKDAPLSTTGSGRKNDTKRGKGWTKSSELAKSGVDMSVSVAGPQRDEAGKGGNAKDVTSSRDLSTIFPSSQRGRGRGYMRNVR